MTPGPPDPIRASPAVSAGTKALLLSACLVLVGVALLGGPPLGEHETIVALIARQTLQTREWLIPQCMDTAFLIKPPLAPWVAALASMALPHDAATGEPVTTVTARLPSVLATIATIIVLWRLSRSMFGRVTAWMTAFIYSTSIAAWLFAVNATAEALLTLFCTWAFAEFWWAQSARDSSRRRLHMLRFYIAFGLAMLAKGPMPLAMVAVPIAVYWWLDRPMRSLAADGMRGIGNAAALGLRQVLPRLRRALTGLGLWWGVPVFLLMFVPWMVYVARFHPYVWRLWDFEYVHRFQGEYPGEGQGGPWYYLPLILGLVFPWSLSLPEALASPFMQAYRGRRRALIYVWVWVITATLIMSAMTFKKPYYLLPVMPACALLLTPVVERFFFGKKSLSVRSVKMAVGAILAALVVATVVGMIVSRKKYPQAWLLPMANWAFPVCAALALVGFGCAAVMYLRGRYGAGFAAVGMTSAAVFTLGWCVFGPMLSNLEGPMALVDRLKACGVPNDAPVYWISNRPDTRVVFYGHRPLRHMVDTYRLVAERAKQWDDNDIKLIVAAQASDLLKAAAPAYLIFQRGQLEQFRTVSAAPMHELLSVDRNKPGEDKDDWVVVTNRLPAARGS